MDERESSEGRMGNEQNWDLRLDRSGLELRAGRHLQLSVSLAMIWWLLTVAGVVSSPYWGPIVL
ncbi:hypothetical protein [Streptomyces sp. NBC_00989]|uniref:hypothetical protein n=1 Tax=Streptomyces sp. NBC_00989 TaxID=2903705 RepID=UPI00386E23C5|nr:hypothetical protein OG714_54515 [Streptomyces sp. NBC_00989]